MKTNNFLDTALRRYLHLRRRLGYELQSTETQLRHFVRFAERESPGGPITTALALRWATSTVSTDQGYRAQRLRSVREFARFCAALDSRTQVPPTRLLQARWTRRAPHIYTVQQVRLIMRLARRISPSGDPLRPALYATLVGLLFCTGLRLGEALRLQIADFDPIGRTLRVPAYKFSGERVLPLHLSTVRALQRYLGQRLRRVAGGTHLFVDSRGRGLAPANLREIFRQITRPIAATGARPQPRWHDFRHSFASRLISYWTRQHEPVAHRLLLLSRYLGHKSFAETWWYVSPAKADLNAAAARFHDYQHHSNPE